MSLRRLFIALAVAGSTATSAQSFEFKVVPEFGGTRPLQPEVVRTNVSDKGPLFGGMQGGLAFEGSYEFAPQWAFMGHLDYAMGRSRFEMPCACVQTQDRVVVLKNEIDYKSVDAMGGLRYRTNSEKFWFARVSIGLGAITSTKREVSYHTNFLDSRPDSTNNFLSGNYSMRNHRGNRILPMTEAGLGRRLGVHHVLDVELFFRNDLGDWVYSVTNYQNVTQVVDVRRRMIGVRCGFLLAGWKVRTRPGAAASSRTSHSG